MSGDTNVKNSGIVPAVVVGLIVEFGQILFGHSLDHSDTTTATLAELKTEVASLSTQLSKLTDQPYVRRDEFESRITGLEQRVSNIERGMQSRSQR